MKNKKKTLINIIFLVICFCATMYYVFHDQDFSDIMIYMKEADSRYWIVGVVLVIAFILSESVIIYYLMRSLSQKPNMNHCFLYSFVGFFFSLVTPSASGGQPAQILFMKKDKLPIHLSTMVLLIVT
ncbi:MAG: lysylphosphatidylglycerol synthase domain-containing protein, partial [Emergencia timonensis]